MYGLTRAMLTLIGVAVAGFLLWFAGNLVSDKGSPLGWGEHWAIAGLAAAAGLTMALSQLLGGWTKWGWPRVSKNLFLIAFLPVFIAGGWVIAYIEPTGHWLGGHVRDWSDALGIGGVVGDLIYMYPAIAFGIGLVFGLTFDTTGPRVRKQTPAATPVPAVTKEHVAATDSVGDDRRIHIGDGGAPTTPQETPEPEPEPAPRTGEPTEN